MFKNPDKKKKAPKLSIITVCYNEKEVEKTLKSVSKEDFDDFEWIVIDGGSSPETLNILDKYKERMDFFITEKDSGIYNAMNKGIQASKGEWLLFLNAGDTLFSSTALKSVFKNIENSLLSYKKADVIYCSCCHRADYNETAGKIVKYPKPKDLNLEFWRQNSLSHAATFIRRELFNDSPYDESFIISGDFEKWVRWKKEGKRFKYLNITVSNFYKTGISQKNILLREEERKKILDKYLMADYETIYALKLFKKILIFKIQKRRDGKFLKFFISRIPVFRKKIK